MSSKVVLMGNFKIYGENYNLLTNHVKNGIIEIVAIVTDEYNFKYINSVLVFEYLDDITEDYDYIILLNDDNNYCNVIKEILEINIPVIPVHVFKIPDFDFDKYTKLLNNYPTIISRHCWGGLLYHSLGLKFNTPFINLFLLEDDFLKLSKNFKHYMQ